MKGDAPIMLAVTMTLYLSKCHMRFTLTTEGAHNIIPILHQHLFIIHSWR